MGAPPDLTFYDVFVFLRNIGLCMEWWFLVLFLLDYRCCVCDQPYWYVVGQHYTRLRKRKAGFLLRPFSYVGRHRLDGKRPDSRKHYYGAKHNPDISNKYGGYAAGLVGHAALEIAARAFFARQDTLTPLVVAVLGMVVTVGASLVLRGPLDHAGLALANSLGVSAEVGLLLWLARRISSIICCSMYATNGMVRRTDLPSGAVTPALSAT